MVNKIFPAGELSGVILAGGKSSRFGDNKAFAKIEGQPLIERTVALFNQAFATVYIVTNEPAPYRHNDAKIIADIFPGCGPLGGIHAGLTASTTFANFVTACDMPFLNLGLIQLLANRLADYDLVLPRFAGRLQPLCALYTKNCLPQIEAQLKIGNYKLADLIHSVNSIIIEEDEISSFGLSGETFVNINTQEEYAALSR